MRDLLVLPMARALHCAALGVLAMNASCAMRVPTVAQTPELAQFHDRIERYLAVRDRAEDAVEQRGRNFRSIAPKERALREQIQILRADARRGDVLTPKTETLLRTLLSVPLKRVEAQENKAAIRDDGPDAFKPAINREYPSTEPLATMPPDVLRALPRLPKGLQYRFIPRYLLLYDVRADMIVDYMPYTLSQVTAASRRQTCLT